MKAVSVSSERFEPLCLVIGRCMSLSDRCSMFFSSPISPSVLLSSPSSGDESQDESFWSPFAFGAPVEANILIAFCCFVLPVPKPESIAHSWNVLLEDVLQGKS